ncbi:hypothetical protein Tco_1226772 [Tanacetum coccineum]
MSDSEDSTVTYTEDPPSPDYVPGPEHPPSPDFVPEPIYPEFMPSEDDVLPVEEQSLPADVSPTANSPGYIIESDPEEDLEEDDEDLEEDPADSSTDRDDDEDEEPFKDDADEEEEDEEEEKDHLALADSIPPPTCRTTARISIRDHTPIPFPSTAEVDRFLAISTPLPSPFTSYSSPLPQIPSPPLPVSSPLPVSPPPLPASPTYPLGYRAAMIRAFVAMMRAVAPSTYILASRSETPPSGTPPLLPIPLPTPSSPLLLSSTVCRAGVTEVTLPPQKRLCITLGPRFEVGKSSSAPTTRPTREFKRDYDTWDEMVEDMQGTPAVTNVAGLSQRMTDFVTTVRQDTNEIYRRLDDAQDDRSLMSGQLNMLHRDRCAYARTARLMESVARLSCEAWVQLMDASDTTRFEVRALRTTILAQQTKIGDLRAADRRRQTQLTEALTLLRILQTQMAVLQSQQTLVRDPAHPNVPEEAGSSS